VGSTADNELTGGLGKDNLSGGGGSDILYAGTGDDVVDAGDGDDMLIGGDGAGNDKYIGGAGTDTVNYALASASITVDLGKGTATSTAGKDTAKIGTDNLSGIENVIAGNFNDTVNGSTGINVIMGGLGADSLYGGADKVKDVFDYNTVADSKTGTARDKVYDFIAKIDKIDLSGMDANTATAKTGDQAFIFNNTTAKANSVWYAVKDVDGNSTTKDIVIYGDVDNNTTADFEIGLVGVTSVAATDFIL
jgi:Ca2+-binding RTX toxin-like protein